MVRESWSHTLSALVYRIRDFQLSEDALQDAILAAWKSWPKNGIPEKPQAWLYRSALRKAIDQIRRRENFETKRSQIELVHELESDSSATEDSEPISDERLRLIFTCCHPALEERTRVALTLRAVCGLHTREVARAFLASESTMAQRLTRAKRKIRAAGIPYRVPPPELWSERLDSVLSVIYFIFNEGYQASSGEHLLRRDLCDEAIRLGRVVRELAPRATEASGLLALMLIHHARRDSRVGEGRAFIPLECQNRQIWNQSEIEEGDSILKAALVQKPLGPYQLQAAISALHAKAKDWRSTDWVQIYHLYAALLQFSPTAVVKLNQAIALSMIEGPAKGLEILDALDLHDYQPFHAAKADLLRRLGKISDAIESYQIAAELTANAAEKAFLQQKAAALRTC